MGYGISPRLREPEVCETVCEHKDCAALREFVASPCRHCSKPIGEESRFYLTDDGGGGSVHAVCAEEAFTREQRAWGGVGR